MTDLITTLALCMAMTLTAQARDVSQLPEYESVVRVERDWLVEHPAQRAAVYQANAGKEIVLSNGLLSRTFRLGPNAATVDFRHRTTGESIIRGVKPEAIVEIEGVTLPVGGLLGQPNYAFLRPEWIDDMTADPDGMKYVGFEFGDPEVRMDWARVRHHAPNAEWPPNGVHLRMDYELPKASKLKNVTVAVHYELYDEIPLLSKWLTIHNHSKKTVTINRFTSEILAAVEYDSYVETRGVPMPTPNIHVETDYSFGGMATLNTTRKSVHWVSDPQYASQVSYLRETPCLLEVRPELGPNIEVEPGGEFETFRAFILPHDSDERERKSLAQRRMYRTIAPWVTENPLMMHARFSDWPAVKTAIDQCAEVGFEMVILTFGSGFNIEDDSDAYVQKMSEYAAYAKSKGVEIGGYSLLSSRNIGPETNVITPEEESPTHGNAPCIESEWGHEYFRKLYNLYEETGFMLLEHDGSYPGDACTSTNHPGHRGHEDSRRTQWRRITDFYKWCRGKGVYLNVPDYYYLNGSTKCGMGYREVNWSLPRSEQVIHTRQNIFDGTWEKTPSMGWMFVPLTEYHGGGAAATIEPLDEHKDHYEQMLYSNLGLGVQACYRGPRLFDTEATKAMVKGQVDWYKKHRDILESDVIHGRRANGRDVDWMLHVNPDLAERGMLLAFNPLNEAVTRTLSVNVYYTGITNAAVIRERDGSGKRYDIDRDYTVRIDVTMPAQGYSWFVIEGE